MSRIRLLIALKTAIQMEIDGKQYYQQAARASKNDLGTKAFPAISR